MVNFTSSGAGSRRASWPRSRRSAVSAESRRSRAPRVRGSARYDSPVTFQYSGAFQTYTVPANPTKLIVQATGGAGGDEVWTYPNGGGSKVIGHGGLGAQIGTTINVTPGEQLTVDVSQQGQQPQYQWPSFNNNSSNIPVWVGLALGGWGGGSGGNGGTAQEASGGGSSGGGASEIADGTTPLVVAGGGGGAGSWSFDPTGMFPWGVGGSGGNAGQTAANGANGKGYSVAKHWYGRGGTGAGQSGMNGSVGGNPTKHDAGNDAGGGGGGGGYNGGDGGSSYVAPGSTGTSITTASAEGDGMVTVTPLSQDDAISAMSLTPHVANDQRPTVQAAVSSTMPNAPTPTGTVRFWAYQRREHPGWERPSERLGGGDHHDPGPRSRAGQRVPGDDLRDVRW
jgi:hypothetical protein